MKVSIWVLVILLFLTCGYGIAETMVASAQKYAALSYWYEKEPNKHHIFTIVLGCHIPTAIYCWQHFGDPMATWKLIENETAD